MRYGFLIGRKAEAIKAALDANYRGVMLVFMVIELLLLGWLVALEAIHK